MSLDNKIVTASFIPAVLLIAAPFMYTVFTGDYPGSHLYFGFAEDDIPTRVFLNIHHFFRNLFF